MILGLHQDTYSGYKQSVCEVRTGMFLHINGPNTIAQTDGQGDSNVTPNPPPKKKVWLWVMVNYIYI